MKNDIIQIANKTPAIDTPVVTPMIVLSTVIGSEVGEGVGLTVTHTPSNNSIKLTTCRIRVITYPNIANNQSHQVYLHIHSKMDMD